MTRIGFIGSAGVGRTTVALELSKRFNVTFLQSRSITQPVLIRDKYDYGSGVFVEHFLAEKRRELELINTRIAKENELQSFVTDRTTLDHCAYMLLGIKNYSEEEVSKMATLCRNHIGTYTHLYYLPWKDQPIQDNNLRTLNRWFQMSVDFLIQGLIKTWNVPVITLNEPTIESVLALVNDKKN